MFAMANAAVTDGCRSVSVVARTGGASLGETDHSDHGSPDQRLCLLREILLTLDLAETSHVEESGSIYVSEMSKLRRALGFPFSFFV